MARLLFILFFLPPLALFAKANICVTSSLTHESTVAQGQLVNGQIPIMNKGDEPVRVKITNVDYLFDSSGKTEYIEPGSHDRSNSDWLKLNTNYIVIPPKQTAECKYQIEIPKDTNLKGGTYWSMVLVEPVEEIKHLDLQPGQTQLTTVMRYGVQIINHIEKSGEYNIRIFNKSINREGGKKLFSLDVENTGSLMLSPNMSVELFDEEGVPQGQYETKKARILPTCSVKYRLDLSSVKEGRYKAIVVLDHGENDIFGAQYQISL